MILCLLGIGADSNLMMKIFPHPALWQFDTLMVGIDQIGKLLNGRIDHNNFTIIKNSHDNFFILFRFEPNHISFSHLVLYIYIYIYIYIVIDPLTWRIFLNLQLFVFYFPFVFSQAISFTISYSPFIHIPTFISPFLSCVSFSFSVFNLNNIFIIFPSPNFVFPHFFCIINPLICIHHRPHFYISTSPIYPFTFTLLNKLSILFILVHSNCEQFPFKMVPTSTFYPPTLQPGSNLTLGHFGFKKGQ